MNIDKFLQPVEGIEIVTKSHGSKTLLTEQAIETGRERVWAGEDPAEVAMDLALDELLLTSSEDELKVLGGAGSGNFGHQGRPGEKGGSGEGGSEAKVRNERSLRALKAFIPIHAESQRYAEANELAVRKMIGGKRTEDNLPVDVITKIDGRTKGVEVKTMINNTNDKITMRKDAIEKKEAWGRSNHASVHTVVLDDRGIHNHAGYSGHRIYYAKGSGSFRLGSMTKVRDAAHLKDLLRGRR